MIDLIYPVECPEYVWMDLTYMDDEPESCSWEIDDYYWDTPPVVPGVVH